MLQQNQQLKTVDLKKKTELLNSYANGHFSDEQSRISEPTLRLSQFLFCLKYSDTSAAFYSEEYSFYHEPVEIYNRYITDILLVSFRCTRLVWTCTPASVHWVSAKYPLFLPPHSTVSTLMVGNTHTALFFCC